MIDYTDLGDLPAATDPQTGQPIGEVLHYVHDSLGSVVGLTDAGDPDAEPNPVPAKLVERYDYDPYGHTYIERLSGTTWERVTASAYGNPFAWTAQRYDAGVGLYHFPFRSYSPELGRLLWIKGDNNQRYEDLLMPYDFDWDTGTPAHGGDHDDPGRGSHWPPVDDPGVWPPSDAGASSWPGLCN